MTIDILPDYPLLQVFHFCRQVNSSHLLWWKPLVHVCRRWRQIIFASPRSLHLVVSCNCRTPVKKSLGIWPPLPISIRHDTWDHDRKNENTIAALQHRDRVSEISINCLRSSVLERLTAAMLEPFPVLASLYLGYGGNTTHTRPLPEAILGGSAPSLKTIVLAGIAFPALPKLLSSATHLVSLQLWRIPITGYISPEVMATHLAALPNLEDLRIEFRACPNHTNSSSLTRVILASLTSFHFKGVSEYLDNLVARIDAPIIQTLSITFYGVVLCIPQLHRFLSYAERPQPPNATGYRPSCLVWNALTSMGSVCPRIQSGKMIRSPLAYNG